MEKLSYEDTVGVVKQVYNVMMNMNRGRDAMRVPIYNVNVDGTVNVTGERLGSIYTATLQLFAKAFGVDNDVYILHETLMRGDDELFNYFETRFPDHRGDMLALLHDLTTGMDEEDLFQRA